MCGQSHRRRCTLIRGLGLDNGGLICGLKSVAAKVTTAATVPMPLVILLMHNSCGHGTAIVLEHSHNAILISGSHPYQVIECK